MFFDDLFVEGDVTAVVGAIQGRGGSNGVDPFRPVALIGGRDLLQFNGGLYLILFLIFELVDGTDSLFFFLQLFKLAISRGFS